MPAQALGPHVASLGMTFYNGTMFPAEYAGSIFNAQHGSWNREVAIGYRVMNIGVNEDGQATSYSMFANGWLNTTLAPSGSNAWGESQVLAHHMQLLQAHRPQGLPCSSRSVVLTGQYDPAEPSCCHLAGGGHFARHSLNLKLNGPASA